MKGSGRPRKLQDEHLAWIAAYLQSKQHKKITAREIKTALLKEFPELISISLKTITARLSTSLNFSYKKQACRFMPFSTKDNERTHEECAVVIAALRRAKVSIVFIDEYNVSESDMRLYNWSLKGREDYLINQPRRQSLHIIAAVTDEQLLCCEVITETIKAENFLAFLSEVKTVIEQL